MNRFAAAMACYAGLAIWGALTLEGRVLHVAWIFLAGLAAKTCIAQVRKGMEKAGTSEGTTGGDRMPAGSKPPEA